MIIIVFDTETTGLDPAQHQLLEVGCVAYDAKEDKILGQFRAVNCQDLYACHPVAAAMNSNLLAEVARMLDSWPKEETTEDNYNKYILADYSHVIARPKNGGYPTHYFRYSCGLDKEFKNWLDYLKITKYVPAGKNFASFDKQFLDKVGIKTPHRCIDPVNFFVDFDNDRLPSLTQCLEQACIKRQINHTAIADCYDVLDLIRTKRNEPCPVAQRE